MLSFDYIFDYNRLQNSIALTIRRILKDFKPNEIEGDHLISAGGTTKLNSTTWIIAQAKTITALVDNLIETCGLQNVFDRQYGEELAYNDETLYAFDNLLYDTAIMVEKKLGLKKGLFRIQQHYYDEPFGQWFIFPVLSVRNEDRDILIETLVRLEDYTKVMKKDIEEIQHIYKLLKEKIEVMLRQLDRQADHLPMNDYTMPEELRNMYVDLILLGTSMRDKLIGMPLPPQRGSYKSLTKQIKRKLDNLA